MPVPESAQATVASRPLAGFSVTVQVSVAGTPEPPSPSVARAVGEIDSSGTGSSSAMVPVAVSAVCPATTASVALPGSLNDRTTVSSASCSASPFTVALMVPPAVSPAAMVRVPAANAV